MKKTLTINLGGSVFNIDEDAYLLLDKYLTNLRIHFHNEEGSDEIMNDFELRISELLGEKIRLGYNVVSIENIEEIINRMGKLEEIFENESGESETKKEATHISDKAEPVRKKKMFRDPDDKIIGGVAGGIAAYTGWDVTGIRIAMVALLFFAHVVTIVVYIILWLVVPIAQTVPERLEMRGVNVTLENIGKTVTVGFEKENNGTIHNSMKQPDKPRTTLQRIADVLVDVIGAILKISLIILAILFVPVLFLFLFISLVVIFALAFGGIGILHFIMPSFDWVSIPAYPLHSLILGCIGVILSIGIPLGSMIYFIFSRIFKYKPISSGVKWVLFSLWVVGVITSIACGTYIGIHIPYILSTGF